nr:hypothetical protein BaRGS_026287 [Batillaria attramentaria]
MRPKHLTIVEELQQGDVVCNTLPNSPERLISDLGIVLAGAAAMNGQILLADGEDFIGSLKDAGCCAVILDPLQPKGAAAVLEARVHSQEGTHVHYPDLPNLHQLFLCHWDTDGEHQSFMDVLEAEQETFVADVTPDDVADVWTTSGSTGFSKLVPRTHDGVLSFGHAFYTFMCLKPGDLYYNDRSLGWGGGFPGSFLTHGTTRVLQDLSKGLPDSHIAFTWDVLRRERVTVAFLVPSQLLQLTDHCEQTQQDDPWKLRVIGSAGQPLRRKHVDAIGKITDRVGIGYGTTEVGIISGKVRTWTTKTMQQKIQTFLNTCLRRIFNIRWPEKIRNEELWERAGQEPVAKQILRRKNDVFVASGIENSFKSMVVTDKDAYEDCNNGNALEGMEMKIVDDDLKDVPQGQMGEIVVRGTQLFKHYLNNQAATQKSFTPDGWCRTGDVGHINDKGEVFTICRKSYSIMRGPYLLYPGWLEDRISRCPGVEDVMIVPVPDPVLYQELCACLIPQPGASLTSEGVRTFCNDLFLTSDKSEMTAVPKYYLFFEQFPTTNTGKTCRRSTTKLARQRLGFDANGVITK